MLDIEHFQEQAERVLTHHENNIKLLDGIDTESFESATLELKNSIFVEVIRPLEEMILMLDVFRKMGLQNVPNSMVVKWQVRFECLLSRTGVIP